ncbi:hypothetical protein AFL01nite_10940 [Aeromicrobium flavum]|uniref:Lipoprotein n=1 Tax=Aeromicrobium flavum TaxID=416568 RepID=A0A512HTJ5_9ACTN|nr:hypothetical protein [Aeromicrobium flavum]GEO88767.1 hypothetical protein AFL01nite_10940 [Aeromicrobium flavum]
MPRSLLRALAATVVPFALLAACDPGSEDAPAAPSDSVLTPPARSAPPAELSPLDQVRLQEPVRSGSVVAEEEGSGPTETRFFRADGGYAFRVMCIGGGTLRVDLEVADEPLSVTCDGTPAGLWVRTDGASTVAWSIRAEPTQRWGIVWFEPTPD